MNETGELTGLPHHISELDEITAMGNTTERLLKSMDRPLYVTLATSRSDRYLPDCQAVMIHGMLDEMMERIYKRVDVIRRDCPKYTIDIDDSDEEKSSESDSGETDSDSESYSL